MSNARNSSVTPSLAVSFSLSLERSFIYGKYFAGESEIKIRETFSVMRQLGISQQRRNSVFRYSFSFSLSLSLSDSRFRPGQRDQARVGMSEKRDVPLSRTMAR